MDPFASDMLMSLVLDDNVSQATEELQQQAAAALGITTLSLRRRPRLAWQAQATPRVDVAEVSVASLGLAGSGTKKMKAPSLVLPEHAAAPCLCDADPEYQIFVVLFTGRSRCVRVRASWGGSKACRTCVESE